MSGREEYVKTANELGERILALIPENPQILTMDSAWGLFDVPGFHCKDINPSLAQAQGALGWARAQWKNRDLPEGPGGIPSPANEEREAVSDQPKAQPQRVNVVIVGTQENRADTAHLEERVSASGLYFRAAEVAAIVREFHDAEAECEKASRECVESDYAKDDMDRFYLARARRGAARIALREIGSMKP